MLNWLKSFWKKQSPAAAAGASASAGPAPTFFTQVKQELAARRETGPGYNNFTPRAVQVLALSRKEADRLNHNFVGTEHVLLGLIRLGQGVSVNVLQKLGLDLETVRLEVEKLIGAGPDQKIIGNIPYTPRVKKVLALAAREAKELNHTYVGTEHILLGLLREGDGLAARVLINLGVNAEETRTEILKELAPNFAANRVIPAENAEPDQGEQTDPNALQLTPRAQQVLRLAREEAARLNYNFVGTEHILLGLLALGNGVAVNVLNKLGADLESVRRELKEDTSPGKAQQVSGNFPYTPRVKKVLAIAVKDATALEHTYVGTEHILLGLLSEGEGPAMRILKNHNIDPGKLRQEILRELDPNYTAGGDGQQGPRDQNNPPK